MISTTIKHEDNLIFRFLKMTKKGGFETIYQGSFALWCKSGKFDHISRGVSKAKNMFFYFHNPRPQLNNQKTRREIPVAIQKRDFFRFFSQNLKHRGGGGKS